MWQGLLLSATFFVTWDILFNNWNIWNFNDRYLLGIRFFDLPLEEYLFFFTVPYSCSFIYACLVAYIPFHKRQDKGWRPMLTMGTVLVLTAIIFHNKPQTLFSFGTSGLGCIVLYFLRRKIPTFRADAFLLMFLISIIPFLAIDGFLTAMPIVIYYHKHNFGVYIYTIPIDDLIYGILLMMSNVAIMEYFKGKARPSL